MKSVINASRWVFMELSLSDYGEVYITDFLFEGYYIWLLWCYQELKNISALTVKHSTACQALCTGDSLHLTCMFFCLPTLYGHEAVSVASLQLAVTQIEIDYLLVVKLMVLLLIHEAFGSLLFIEFKTEITIVVCVFPGFMGFQEKSHEWPTIRSSCNVSVQRRLAKCL